MVDGQLSNLAQPPHHFFAGNAAFGSHSGPRTFDQLLPIPSLHSGLMCQLLINCIENDGTLSSGEGSQRTFRFR